MSPRLTSGGHIPSVRVLQFGTGTPVPACPAMPVTVLCPACDCEVTADSASGAVQCPTCWAKVPLDTARRKPTDTPPPKPPADQVPVARKAAKGDAPPRAKRAEEPERPRRTRSRRPGEKEKNGGVVWAVALLALVLAAGAGVVVFTLTAPPAAATFSSIATTPTTRQADEPADEWVLVAVPEGATLFAPGPLKRQPASAANEPGVCHSATDGNTTAEVFVFDLKADRRADREEFLGKRFVVGADRLTRVGVRPITGGDATEYYASDVTGFDHAALVIGRGGRWFVFHLRWKPADDPKDRRREAFLSKSAVSWSRVDPQAEPAKPKDPKPADPVKAKEPPLKPTDLKAEAEPIRETWAAIDNKAGFAAVAPKGVRPERLFVEQKRVSLGGQKWQIEDGHCVYHVSYLDLPADFEPDVAKLVKAVVPFNHAVGADADAVVGGKKGTEWEIKHWEKTMVKAHTVRCGFRLFITFAVSRHGRLYGEDATYTQRADKFAAGLKFTFDAKSDDPYPGEGKWAALADTAGFSCKVPKGKTAVKAHDVGFNPKASGKHYRHEAGGMVFEVFAHDLPAKMKAADVTKEMLGFDKLVSGPIEVRGADRRWTTYELGGPDRPVLFRTATVGARVYTVRVFPEPHGDDRVGAREFRDKAARFFDDFVAQD